MSRNFSIRSSTVGASVNPANALPWYMSEIFYNCALQINYREAPPVCGVRTVASLSIPQGDSPEGDLRRGITVTLSIINFDIWLLAQIVGNREGRISIQFLGTGDNFSKSYYENQIRSEWVRMGRRARAAAQVAGAIQLPYKSVFVITFRKNCPHDLKMV